MFEGGFAALKHHNLSPTFGEDTKNLYIGGGSNRDSWTFLSLRQAKPPAYDRLGTETAGEPPWLPRLPLPTIIRGTDGRLQGPLSIIFRSKWSQFFRLA